MNLAQKQESAQLAEQATLQYGPDSVVAQWYAANAKNPVTIAQVTSDLAQMHTIGMTRTEMLAALNDKYMGSATQYSVAGLGGQSLVVLLAVGAAVVFLLVFLNRKK